MPTTGSYDTTWQEERPAEAAPSRSVLQSLAIAVGYLALYVVMDWASFLEPIGSYAVTPWNPQTGISLALVLIFGRRYIPLLFVAPLLADLAVRGFPVAAPAGLVLAAIIGAGYSLAGTALTSELLRFDRRLASSRDVLLLLVTALVSSASVAAAYVLVLVASGHLGGDQLSQATARLWVGDVIGIVVVTPFLLILAQRPWTIRPDTETASQIAATVFCLTIIWASAATRDLHAFYLLFLPVVWIALRHGLSGAASGLLLAQVGLMLAVAVPSKIQPDLMTYQAMMLVLAVTGLIIGVTVSERSRIEGELRRQQEAQSRLSRLGAIGELSAGLAHEINQPLSAAATYARIAIDEVEAARDGKVAMSQDRVVEQMTKSLSQVQRAAVVVRGLREFIQRGQCITVPTSVVALLDEAQSLSEANLAATGIRLLRNRSEEMTLPLVEADRLQVGLVLTNLIANARDALADQAGGGQIIAIMTRAALQDGVDVVEFSVADNGPGFAADFLAHPFEPLRSSKSFGLGIGLALARSIVEAHGGRMWLNNRRRGAIVKFTLKAARAQP